MITKLTTPADDKEVPGQPKVSGSPIDPFTREFYNLNKAFCSYFMLFYQEYEIMPDFDYQFDSASVRTAEDGLDNYEKVRKNSVDVLKMIKEYPVSVIKPEALAQLEIGVCGSLSILEKQYSFLDWRKLLVQKHFKAFIGDIQVGFGFAGPNQPPSVERFFIELSDLRDSVFEDSAGKYVEAYLEACYSIREETDYQLYLKACIREASERLKLMETLVAMEDELSVRVLFEEATH